MLSQSLCRGRVVYLIEYPFSIERLPMKKEGFLYSLLKVIHVCFFEMLSSKMIQVNFKQIELKKCNS